MRDVSGCCAISPASRLPWTGCADSTPDRLLYESTKLGSGGIGPLLLTAELLHRLAAWCRRRALHRDRYFTSVCARERPLTGNFCGASERQELAGLRPSSLNASRSIVDGRRTTLCRHRGESEAAVETD